MASIVKLYACSLGGSDGYIQNGLAQCLKNFVFLTCRYDNKKHVALGAANINVCFQDTGLPGCFAGLTGLESSDLPTSETRLWKPQISQQVHFESNVLYS